MGVLHSFSIKKTFYDKMSLRHFYFRVTHSLREKCPSTEFFLVRIFTHSERRDTSYLSVFSPNAGRYGPEITPYLDTFHIVIALPVAVLVDFLIIIIFYLSNCLSKSFMTVVLVILKPVHRFTE